MLYNTYERGGLAVVETREDLEKVLREAYENGLEAAKEGKCADYIPELAKADPGAFGMYVLNEEGDNITFGDVDTRFSI